MCIYEKPQIGCRYTNFYLQIQMMFILPTLVVDMKIICVTQDAWPEYDTIR